MEDFSNSTLNTESSQANSAVEEWRPGANHSTLSQTHDLSFRDAKGYSSADYDKAARELEDEGKPELAARARANAESVRYTEASAKENASKQAWHEARLRELASIPELQDPASPLRIAAENILSESPAFQQITDGFKHAAALARGRLLASELPLLRDQIASLKQENDRLARLTSIPGSPPARIRPGEDMELNAHDLRRMAREFDSEISV